MREANGFLQDYVGTEHLLLGLLREPTGRATALLLAIRRDPDMVRERLLDLVSSPGFISPEAPVVEVPTAIVPDVDVPDHRSRLAGVDRAVRMRRRDARSPVFYSSELDWIARL